MNASQSYVCAFNEIFCRERNATREKVSDISQVLTGAFADSL